MIKNIYILFFCLLSTTAFSQDWNTETNKGKTFFNEGKYSEAIASFNNAISKYENKVKAEDVLSIKCLIGIAYLKNNNISDGQTTLTSVIDYYKSKDESDENYFLANSQLAVSLFGAGKYIESEPFFQNAINSHEAAKKATDDTYLTLVQYLATIKKAKKEYEEADKLYRKVLKGKAALYTKDSEAYKNTLVTLAKMHLDNSSYVETTPLIEEAITILQNIKQTKTKEYSTLNIQLAQLYIYLGYEEKAANLYSDNLRNVKKTSGKDSKEYLKSLHELGNFYRENHKIGKANRRYNEALEIAKANGFKDYEASTLNQIGLIHDLEGDFNDAQHSYKEAITIYEKISVSKAKPAICYLNLGDSYMKIEKYVEAEIYYKKSIALAKEIKSTDSEVYINILNNVAVFYQKLGQYNIALAYYKEVLASMENQDIKFTKTLISLASLYEETNELENSERLFNQASKIANANLGSNHPHIAEISNNYAKLLLLKKDYTGAIEQYEKAYQIQRKTYGKSSIETSVTINNIGRVYEKQGLYDKSLEYYLKSLKIKEEALGSLALSKTQLLGNIARVYQAKNDNKQAFEYWKLCINNYLSIIDVQFPIMSEGEKESFYNKIRDQFEQFNNFVIEHHKSFPEALILMYNTQLRTKGMLIRATNKIRRNIYSSNNTALIKQYNDWVESKEILAKIYTGSSKSSHLSIDSLKKIINESEKSLSASVLGFDNEIQHPTWEDVRNSLNSGEFVVDAIRVQKYSIEKGGIRNQYIKYYAFLIIEKSSKTPKLVVFNNGQYLENRGARYYKNTTRFKLKDYKSYYQYWQRLESHIKGAKKILFSPDGIYNTININTLQNPEDNSYLLEKFNLEILTNTTDILTPIKSQKINKVTIYGNPDFITSNGTRHSLTSLPGAEQEAKEISKLVKERSIIHEIHTNEKATEESLKKTNNTQILHIATHGFFLNETTKSAEHHNPLFNSGIYLSSREEEEDGILYAYEVMNLNLEKTELVVFSACETGLGTIKNGEGVYGLQRAVRVAGAKSVIISLWKVDDAATKLLMTSFYKYYLESGNKKEALRKAQKDVKEKYDDRFYWGAFILIGE